MLIKLDCGLVDLARRQIVEFVDGCGMSVSCTAGSLWITQHGDSRDVLLGPGQSFVLDCHGRAVVQALEASGVRFAPD